MTPPKVNEKELQELNLAMERADMANDAFAHLFGEPTPREDYEATEIEAMRGEGQ